MGGVMSDRTCLLGCTKPGVHYATCPNPEECWGCAEQDAHDGSLVCGRCFARTRRLLDDLPDLMGRLDGLADPLSASVLDQVRVRASVEPPAPVGADLIDARTLLRYVAWMVAEWGHDVAGMTNDTGMVLWVGEHVLTRHKPVDGLMPAWSVQDVMDRWGVERRSRDTYVFPDEDTEEARPVTEWSDPFLLEPDAIMRAGVDARTFRRWVTSKLIEPVARVKFGKGWVRAFRASAVDAAKGRAEAAVRATQYRAKEETR